MATDNVLKDSFEELGQFIVTGAKYLIILVGGAIAIYAVTELAQGVARFIGGLF